MLETTKQKIAKLFTPQTLERIERSGLMVVDKQDFEVVMNGYDTLANENRDLRVRNIRLEREMRDGQVPGT